MITHKPKIGSEARSFVMAKNLVALGHDVSIMLISSKSRFGITEYESDGIHVIETPDLLWGRLRTGWDPWATLNRVNYLGKTNRQYDLIHCFETRPSTIYPALYLSRKKKIPLIIDWNDWWGHHGLIEVNRPFWYKLTFFKLIETYYEEAFRTGSAGQTVITTALKQRAIDLGAEEERVCIIHGGAPGGYFPDDFQPKSISECRKLMGMPAQGPILGFISADTHLDMDIVMASLAIVAKKYTDVKLIITGNVKQSIHKMISKYKVEDRIIFTGFLPSEEFPVYLGCSDVFLLPLADRPYNHGRWPNKMGDYLSIGRPTVSNPVGDITSCFQKHEVGLLASWSPEDFAEKIIYLLDNPEVCERFGQNALIAAKSDFDWKNLVKILEAFYVKILGYERSAIKNGD
jgi:glycosyltransferase involved in cell wall biosynthesis